MRTGHCETLWTLSSLSKSLRRQVGEPKKVLEPLEERNLLVLPLCHFAHLLLFFEHTHTTVSLPFDFLAPFGENGLPSKTHNRHFFCSIWKNLRNKAKPGLGIYEYFPISFSFFSAREKALCFPLPSLCESKWSKRWSSWTQIALYSDWNFAHKSSLCFFPFSTGFY